MSKNFQHWVILNEKGKQLYGKVFPDGIIPVVSMAPKRASFPDGIEDIYLVRHEELDPDTIEKWLDMIAKIFDAPTAAVRRQMETMRIPIRGKYVSSSGTSQMALFT